MFFNCHPDEVLEASLKLRGARPQAESRDLNEFLHILDSRYSVLVIFSPVIARERSDRSNL